MDILKIYENYIGYIKKNKDLFEFKWLKIEDMHLIENYKGTAWEENPNPFLQSTKHDKAKLAESIIKHGMIFPFFSKEISGRTYIVLGSHRLKSLKMLSHKVQDKRYLCINLPDSIFIEDTFKTSGEMIRTLRAYPSLINKEAIINLGDGFEPFRGFNNIEYFKGWINVR